METYGKVILMIFRFHIIWYWETSRTLICCTINSQGKIQPVFNHFFSLCGNPAVQVVARINPFVVNHHHTISIYFYDDRFYDPNYSKQAEFLSHFQRVNKLNKFNWFVLVYTAKKFLRFRLIVNFHSISALWWWVGIISYGFW